MSRLVRLYPEAWRARYGAELVMLIEERPPSLADRIDIVRGAVDAQLHPHVLVGGPEPAPWTHRVPGFLALSAGVSLTAAILIIAFGPGPDWGVAESFIGVAMMLMLICLPGDYLAPFGRRIGLALGGLAVGLVALPATGWWEPFLVIAVVAYVVAICGLLTIAAIRAGIAATSRWLLLASTVLLPLVAIGAHALLRSVTGIELVPDGSPGAALLVLPYGLAWLLVGLRMAVRGSRTITDPPFDLIPASEVQAA